MRYHVVSLPWTATTAEYLTCAYTQKVVKFARMYAGSDDEVFVYGGEENEAPCTEHVPVLSESERAGWFGEWGTEGLFEKVTWDVRHDAWASMNARAAVEISRRRSGRDVVLLTGGNCMKPLREILDHLAPDAICCEPFCGYEGVFSDFVAYESHVWRHHVAGLMNATNGRWYDDVIPNYFDPDEFPRFTSSPSDSGYLLYVGRLIDRKGVHVAAAVAERAGIPLKVAGPGMVEHGDGWVRYQGGEARCPGLEYVGILGVEERNELMDGAIALACPTLYLEPFGGVAVEAMMSGTPVIASPWGAFVETVRNPGTGRLFHTLQEGADAVETCRGMNPAYIRADAQTRYSIANVKCRFDRWFAQLDGLRGEGWTA